jgi:class 3 adenylate cyclase
MRSSWRKGVGVVMTSPLDWLLVDRPAKVFGDRGERALKGVRGTWRLFAVTRDEENQATGEGCDRSPSQLTISGRRLAG